MDFFCRTTAGVEDLIAAALKTQLKNVSINDLHWRRINFSLSQPESLASLSKINFVDDVYLSLGEITELKHQKSELTKFESLFNSLDCVALINNLEEFKSFDDSISFYITTSRFGKHNFNSSSVTDVITQKIIDQTNWTPKENFHEADLKFRVIIENELAIVGLSIFETPLHKRAYKVCHTPGSLKPPIANLIQLLIGGNHEDIFLDATCGSGTLLIESKLNNPSSKTIGSDISISAIQCALTNSNEIDTPNKFSFFVADVIAYPIKTKFVTKFISNLPWGRQAKVENLQALLAGYINLILNLGTNDFVCAILSDQIELITQQIEATDHLTLLFARQISLFGAKPYIIIIGGPAWAKHPEGVFSNFSLIGQTIDQSIITSGNLQPYSIDNQYGLQNNS